MPNIKVYNMAGEVVSEMELSAELFAAEVKESVIHSVVVAQLANKRQGTKSALTRTEVAGGGKKPYRQKGTGRARQGSTRAPQFRTGGVVFAPKPRDFSVVIPKKLKRLALKGVLTDKFNNDDIIVIDKLALDAPKTKEMVKLFKNLGVSAKALVVTDGSDEAVIRAARNLCGVQTAPADLINVYDLMAHDKLIITVDAVNRVQEVFA